MSESNKEEKPANCENCMWRNKALDYANRMIEAAKALKVSPIPGTFLAAGEEKAGELIQHVGYDADQLGRNK